MPPSPLLLPLRSPSELSSPYLVTMDLETYYEIDRTATFISSSGYTRVALQFPDELLKDSTKVVRALRAQLRSLRESGDVDDVKLYVMADTTYGSCCVDEVGALHVNADCVVHYGHTCLSPTSTLPAFFVFGKASISVTDCVKSLSTYALSTSKPIVVLFGLEYAHAVPGIKEAVAEASPLSTSGSKLEFHFADAAGSIVNPIKDQNTSKELHRQTSSCSTNGGSCAISGNRYSICGLTWNLPEGCKIDDHLLCWIGSDNSAFANLVLTFNGCEIVRYDATQNCLVTDFSQQRRILKRRYYLVEKAKDANIVGILVGTLGVAGYLHMIHQMKELISAAGKKAYTLVMGRPNPAKLANFPECDVFIYVSCAQTVLMDSKEFLAPVITPFEAMLALTRGREWTGEYVMEFRDLINLSCPEVRNQPGEPRFSFLQGGYVECLDEEEDDGEDKEGVVALVNATEKALQLRDKGPNAIAKGAAKSGAEFFAGRRSYHGLDMQKENSLPEAYLIGRSGRAAGYADEKRGSDNL